ncbi:unnamed protein product [Rangifer tarandus platyrhynchus]|uniref:Uncharacterized protein n=2 Tax=Rangifer tarandus platyrhynchus TaxID=3082113 RepID=A0ACB1MKJ1_RANTA|nr:unnamed protein product [Rangifer tarandus platyrhynchus]
MERRLSITSENLPPPVRWMREQTSQPCVVKAEMEEGARRQGNNRPRGHGLTLFAASFPLIKVKILSVYYMCCPEKEDSENLVEEGTDMWNNHIIRLYSAWNRAVE